MINKRVIKRICDDFARWAHDNLHHVDANAGVFARQLVTATISELFKHEFEETKWANGQLVPFDTGLSDGATEYSYNELVHTGEAKIVADNATDIPLAELQGVNNVRPVKTIACGFSYSTQEIRSAMLNGMFNIVAEKSEAAREAHDFALNRFIRDGVPSKGLDGFTNAPGIAVQIAASGDWAGAATAATIVNEFSAAANSIMSASGGVETPNTAVFPLAEYLRISTLQNSAASDITVLQYLRQAFPMITDWVWEPGLSAADSAGTGPACMIYNKNPRKSRVVMPMSLQALPPEARGLIFKVALESRFGGVMAPKPGSILRLEGI